MTFSTKFDVKKPIGTMFSALLLSLLLVLPVNPQTRRRPAGAPSQPAASRKVVETISLQDGREIRLYDNMTYAVVVSPPLPTEPGVTETTINKLVSDFGMLGTRVRVELTFVSIDRSRKMLDATSAGWGEGSRMSVSYGGTNMEEYFTNTDPKCCKNRYVVIGKVAMYSNAYQLYIQADKIQQLRP